MHLGWPVGADRERGPRNTLLAKRVLYNRSRVGGLYQRRGGPIESSGLGAGAQQGQKELQGSWTPEQYSPHC